MVFSKKTFTPDAVEAARKLFDETETPLDEIATTLGITRATLKSRIKEWGWGERRSNEGTARTTNKARAAQAVKKESTSRTVRAARTPRATPRGSRATSRAVGTGRADRGSGTPKGRASSGPLDRPAATPEALAQRVQRVVERELEAIDRVLNAIGAADSAEAERSARTLASLARALKEVMRLNAPEETPEADDDDAVPRDLDEFRRELARRLEALAAEETTPAAGDGE